MLKKFNGVVSTVETITPQMAMLYLEKNKNNRAINRKRVDTYASDMRNGNWTPGSAISFFEDGHLADGQHRLLAIVQADVSVVLVVVRNLPVESKLNHNTGYTQTACANISMYTGSNCIFGVRINQASAYVRAAIEVEVSQAASILSSSDLVEKIDRVSEGLSFISPYVKSKRKGTSASGIWATVLAASYIVDKNRLAAFCEVLTGQRNAIDPCEAMVMRFAQLMITSNHSGAAFRLETFLKTQRCVKAFIDGQSLTKFFTSDGVIYSMKERLGFSND